MRHRNIKEAQFLQGIAGTLELFHRSALAFQEVAGEATGHPVAVFQRIDQAGYKLPIDERILADTDTLMVFGLDHLLSEQEAAPEEISAIREWLRRDGTCLVLAPHHDVGFTEDFAQRQVEYDHHGDPLVPRQQRFSQYTRSLMKALDVPVHNRWGLRPAVVEGTKEIAPLTAVRDLDAARLLDNVTTFNFHPHLPHYELTAPEGDSVRVLGRQRDRPRQTASLYRGRQHRIQRADLDAAVWPTCGRHRPRRLDELHHAFRRHRQPQEFLAQPCHHEVMFRRFAVTNRPHGGDGSEKGESHMPGMAAMAMGAAPVLGGALLGAAVGQLRGPDMREGIKQDLELLEQLPETEAARREALRRSINDRIDELIVAEDKARQLRASRQFLRRKLA